MFSSQGLIELVKALAKVGLLGGVAVWLIWSNLETVFSLSLESPTNAIQHMGDLHRKNIPADFRRDDFHRRD